MSDVEEIVQTARKRNKKNQCRLFRQTNSNYANMLDRKGFTVIPFIQKKHLPKCREYFDKTLLAFPEFKSSPIDEKTGKPFYVMGGFSALGNPSSFHNNYVKKIRMWAMYTAVTELWSKFIKKKNPDVPKRKTFKLEQIVDRMMYRPAKLKASAESWHRDEARACSSEYAQEVFGGWVNFDDEPQYFNCVQATHKDKPMGNGFAPIRNGEEMYRDDCLSVEVPPGHILVFYEHIVHEVVSKSKNFDSYRLFLGWRLSNDPNPLIQNLDILLKDMAVMPLKSGQIPPMYANLHWCNWIDKITHFSKFVKDECKETRVRNKKKPNEAEYQIVQKQMKSLKDLNMLSSYKKYKKVHVDILKPNNEWKLKSYLNPKGPYVTVKLNVK